MKNILISSVVLTFISINAAAAVSDNLTPFVSYSGNYTVFVETGSYCSQAYQSLQLEIKPNQQTVTETFIGEGAMHGQPTAGVQDFSVSVNDTYELPSSTGRRLQRVVVKKQAIIVQESTFAPLFGLFGKWKDNQALLTFHKDGAISVYRGGYNCKFIRD